MAHCLFCGSYCTTHAWKVRHLYVEELQGCSDRRCNRLERGAPLQLECNHTMPPFSISGRSTEFN
eukprot:209903-Amphidinium_carterae.1